MAAAPQSCDPHLDLFPFEYRLPRFEEALGKQRKIKIVAIGSSSTAGESDIIPFPHRLELGLRSKFPGRMIDVINRGIGGQEAPEELSRFECDVMVERPTLVIWQVGTNAIYCNTYQPPDVAGTVATGLSLLKSLEADVIMMDLQYAPLLFQDEKGNPDPQKEAKTRQMVSMISAAARDAEEVNVFRRFALMEHWVKVDKIDWPKLIASDNLHQTEFATDCVTKALKAAIEAKVGPVPGVPPPVA